MFGVTRLCVESTQPDIENSERGASLEGRLLLSFLFVNVDMTLEAHVPI